MVNLKKKIKIEGAYLMAVCPHNYERKQKTNNSPTPNPWRLLLCVFS